MSVPRAVQPAMFDGYPDRPVGTVPPSVMAGTNADLMFNVAPLYLTGSVMDVTYGRGGWWQRFTPDPFIKHDLYTLDGVDFRALPEAEHSVDTVCFDPPYMPSGGDSTGALKDQTFQHRYGIGISRHGCTTNEHLFDLILSGLDETLRVAAHFALVKCMEFAQGGGFHDVPHLVTLRATDLGWSKHDQIIHYTGSGPGGHNIFDIKRARRHHSYLLVFAR